MWPVSFLLPQAQKMSKKKNTKSDLKLSYPRTLKDKQNQLLNFLLSVGLGQNENLTYFFYYSDNKNNKKLKCGQFLFCCPKIKK